MSWRQTLASMHFLRDHVRLLMTYNSVYTYKHETPVLLTASCWSHVYTFFLPQEAYESDPSKRGLSVPTSEEAKQVRGMHGSRDESSA